MLTKAAVLLDSADVKAIRRATGSKDLSHGLAMLVNKLTPADGPTARAGLGTLATQGASHKRNRAQMLAPVARKPAAKKAAAKKPTAKKSPAKKVSKTAPKKGGANLSKAEFLARMAAGRAKAARAKKRAK